VIVMKHCPRNPGEAMRFPYDTVDWSFLARILDENSRRLSRTRVGVNDTGTSTRKRPLRLQGDALRCQSAANEARVQQFLFRTRHDAPPADGPAVLALLWHLAELTNAGLLPPGATLREWPSYAELPATPGRAVLRRVARLAAAELPEALDRFADVVARRWAELAGDPVPLAAWAEWELSGGSLHPFYDACGRIARAFGALLLVRASWLPPLYEAPATYFEQGHGGTAAFTAYVRRRIQACAQWIQTPGGESSRDATTTGAVRE
jgi:hypothetical protein